MTWRIANIAIAVTAIAAASSCATLEGWTRSKSGGDGKILKKGDVTCLDLLPEVKQTPVRACETPSIYDVAVGERRLTYDKRVLRQHLREGVARLVAGTTYPVRSLKRARVELWLNAPVFEPTATHFVAVVLSAGGNFAFALPLDQRAWTFDRDAVMLLGRDHYPSLNAKRAGTIIVEAAHGATPDRFADYLAQNGFLAGGAYPVAQLAVAPFGEAQAARLLSDPAGARLYVGSVRMLAAGDKEGAKARAFVIDLGP